MEGFLKRKVGGTDSAGWRIAAVSPNNFIRILCGPVVRNPRRLLFQLPNRAATTPRNSLGLPELLDGFFSLLAVKECGFFMIPNARHVLPLVLLMLEGTLPWTTTATSSCRGRNAIFISRSITFSGMRAKPGTNALTSQPPWAWKALSLRVTFSPGGLPDSSICSAC